MKEYWLVKIEYYDKINNILNVKFDNFVINKFKKEFKKGVYIIKYIDNNNNVHCGFMPYPFFNDSDTKNKYSSSVWLENRDFVYCGEISRKAKLNKINKI